MPATKGIELLSGDPNGQRWKDLFCLFREECESKIAIATFGDHRLDEATHDFF
jgi:hypothetical protein